MTSKRKQAERKGRLAEQLCVLTLRLKGYRILGVRVKYHGGEIDIVASRNRVVAFVEVKARASETDGLHAISDDNQHRIQQASQQWMARHPQLADYGWRFDAMVVGGGWWPRHVRDAWRPD